MFVIQRFEIWTKRKSHWCFYNVDVRRRLWFFDHNFIFIPILCISALFIKQPCPIFIDFYANFGSNLYVSRGTIFSFTWNSTHIIFWKKWLNSGVFAHFKTCFYKISSSLINFFGFFLRLNFYLDVSRFFYSIFLVSQFFLFLLNF